MVQLIMRQEDPDVVLEFKSGAVLNCYRGLSYTKVVMDSPCDIQLDPHTTLLIDQDGQKIRVLKSVKRFKPLGALVSL